MTTGMREIQLNLAERATSDDVVRAEKFKGQDIGELLRYLLDVEGDDDLHAGSLAFEHTSLDTPLRAEIINGLLVVPVGASLSLQVQAGVIYAIAPDGDVDASVYKFVRDPGVQTLGALVFTANTSGLTRIDVVECRINPVQATVAATRDVFNTTTGTFAGTSVTKERKSRLEYRVRLGTPGAGFPGSVNGWLPLVVAVSNTGATTSDDFAMWDVRPLITDRVFSPSANTLTRKVPWAAETYMTASVTGAAGVYNAVIGNRRLGGRLRSGNDNPPLDADVETIDLTAAKNREAGFATVAFQPWYLYLCLPFGLPRWAKYTTDPGRTPSSPRGIPLVSTQGCGADGSPTSDLTLPAPWTGSPTVLNAVCVGMGYANETNVFRSFFGSNAGMYLNVGEYNINVANVNTPVGLIPTNVISAGYVTTTLQFSPGVHYPGNAKEVYVEFTSHWTTHATTTVAATAEVVIKDAGLSVGRINVDSFAALPGAAGSIIAIGMWLPVPQPAPGFSTSDVFYDVVINLNGFTATAAGTSAARIVGYRL